MRRGSNNRQARSRDPEAWGTRRLPGLGFVAARFRHRTSRAGDPQLHWHVLVANITRGPDGRWSALDGMACTGPSGRRERCSRRCSVDEMSRRLGVEWLPVQDDVAEVAGVPRRVCRWFSKRRIEIEAELERLGTAGPAAAAAATLATRPSASAVDVATLDAHWRDQAIELGWGPDALDRLLVARPALNLGPARLGVAPHSGRPGRRPGARDGRHLHPPRRRPCGRRPPRRASVEAVEQAVASVLASPELVPVGSPQVRPAGWEDRFTARRLLHQSDVSPLPSSKAYMRSEVSSPPASSRRCWQSGRTSGRIRSRRCDGCAVRATGSRCWSVGPAPARRHPGRGGRRLSDGRLAGDRGGTLGSSGS